jgi:ABC-type transport system substrate-binding protein
MPSFDIHYETSYVAAQPIGPLYNGLLAHDVYNDSEIVGDLAERWEIAEDGKCVTFHLHKVVKFHDGSDFTCADAQYSMAKLADRKRANPTFVAVLEEVYDSARGGRETECYAGSVSIRSCSSAPRGGHVDAGAAPA